MEFGNLFNILAEGTLYILKEVIEVLLHGSLLEVLLLEVLLLDARDDTAVGDAARSAVVGLEDEQKIVRSLDNSHVEYVQDKNTAFEMIPAFNNVFERKSVGTKLFLKKTLL